MDDLISNVKTAVHVPFLLSVWHTCLFFCRASNIFPDLIKLRGKEGGGRVLKSTWTAAERSWEGRTQEMPPHHSCCLILSHLHRGGRGGGEGI